MQKNYDLTIVGSGIIGVWAAFHITQLAPDLKVLLIDKSLVGRGTTQYSLGLSYSYGKNEIVRRLTSESLAYWQSIQSLIPKLSIQPLPFYAVVNQSKIQDWIDIFVDHQIQPLDNSIFKEIAQYTPLKTQPKDYAVLGSANSNQGHYNFNGSIALAGNVTEQMVHYLRKNNKKIDIYEGIEIRQFREEHSACYLTTQNGHEIRSQKILLALGPWLINFLKNSSYQAILSKKKLRTKKIVSLHFNKLASRKAPMLFLLEDESILIPNPFSKQWQFSFKADEWDLSPNINQLSISATDEEKAFSILKKYCPKLIKNYRGGRVFCDTYGENATPLYQCLPESSNIAIAGAGSGIGFRLAPAIAKAALKSLYPP